MGEQLAPQEQEWLRVDTRWRDRMARRLRDLRSERDELRAVLAPLLDVTWRVVTGEDMRCLFCDERFTQRPGTSGWTRWEIDHAPDCPVLDKARLLGRDRAPAPGAGEGGEA